MDRPRGSRFLALLLATLLLAAGCGSAGAARPAAHPAAHSTATATAAFPVTLTDDTGRQVRVPARPQRIVSVTEGTDEILFGLVAPSRIVGVTKYAAEPGESWVAGRVGSIKQFASANAEAILALKPDLIFVASYTKPGVVQQLEQGGVPVIEFSTFNSLADIQRHILLMGRAVGETAKARRLVAHMNAQLASVHAKVAKLPPTHVLYYASDGYVFGAKTTPDELLRDAGAVNVADAAGITSWKKVTLETVASLKPDWLLTDENEPGFAQKLLKNPALAGLPAVKAHHVVALPDRDLTVLSQYFSQAVADVAAIVHPGAFGR